MLLAKVIGTVVSTAKARQLENLKLLVVEKVTLPTLDGSGEHLIALDAVGANEGEIVFCVTGSSARMTDISNGKPSDTTITAIVDRIELEGSVVYRKNGDSV